VSINRLLYAPNIHQGGGRALLLPLLENLQDAVDVVFVLDARMPLSKGMCLKGSVYRVKPTLFSRLIFEWRLRGLIASDMVLLCMGNLPPLFAHAGNQQVFVQNRYLIDDVSLTSFPLFVRFRLMVERWWLRSRASHVSRFIVQTATMQRLIKKSLGLDADVFPFSANMNHLKSGHDKSKVEYDFLYVASGEPHKNHKTLIDAWVMLANKGLFPSLCLTLDSIRFPKLCAHISALIKTHQLNISMIGECTHTDIEGLYRTSSAMIYPSLFESFGLPLIEAAYAGLPVLASDASYVVDVIQPSAVFDPVSPESIADAVQTFDHSPARLNVDLLDAHEFIVQVFSKDVAV